MRLDFNVLWVDDQPERVRSQITGIKRRMEDQGFEFRAHECRSITETSSFLGQGLFNDEIDLVLVDWDLGSESRGQEAIGTIRQYLLFKDVVFYSSLTDADTLRKAAFDLGLEGVFCAARMDLTTEVMGVFESLVKKVLDLDHTRGIVMGATSDIDHMVAVSLERIHSRLDDNEKTKLIEKAVDLIGGRLEEHRIKLDKLIKSADFGSFLQAHYLLTANDRLKILAGALKLEALADCHQFRAKVTHYMDNVVPKRNELGHRVLSPEGRPIAIGTFEGKEVGLEDMRTLRCLLLNLRSEFRELKAILAG
ncbi:MAG: hypothetical protein OJI70_14930 [Zavarzinia sp.]|nr:hypothetical protein [Zavarzinia sp.]